VRPPRFFRTARSALGVFSDEENTGEELLARIARGMYRSDGYLWHAIVEQEKEEKEKEKKEHHKDGHHGNSKRQPPMLLLVTRQRLIYAHYHQLRFLELEWVVDFDDLVLYELELNDCQTATAEKKTTQNGYAERSADLTGANAVASPMKTKTWQRQAHRFFSTSEEGEESEAACGGVTAAAAAVAAVAAPLPTTSVVLYHTDGNRDRSDVVRYKKQTSAAKQGVSTAAERESSSDSPRVGFQLRRRELSFGSTEKGSEQSVGQVLCSVLLAQAPQVPYIAPFGVAVPRWSHAWKSDGLSGYSGLDLIKDASEAITSAEGGRSEATVATTLLSSSEEYTASSSSSASSASACTEEERVSSRSAASARSSSHRSHRRRHPLPKGSAAVVADSIDIDDGVELPG
jgi:hypothetical protein